MSKRTKNGAGGIYPVAGVAALLAVWFAVSACGIVPPYMLPSPLAVISALFRGFGEMRGHLLTTLLEAAVGLIVGAAASFLIAAVMDSAKPLKKAIYPILVITQTIPVIAVAPLLTLWLGYGVTPKIALVILICFFPLAVGLADGFASADPDAINLLRTMGASRVQLFAHVKLPQAAPFFFAGLKMSVSYAVIGAVISEWLGGNKGLGVYMNRVRSSFAFDKLFAAVIVIVLVSLLLMKAVEGMERILLKNQREGM